MSYQNVGTPRFIVDWLQWWKSLGLLYGTDIWNGGQSTHSSEAEAVNNLIGLNPSSQTVVDSIAFPPEGFTTGFNYRYGLNAPFPVHDINIVGLLGHNFAGYDNGDITARFTKGGSHQNISNSLLNLFDQSLSINFQKDGGNAIGTTYNGYTIGGISKRKIYPGQVHYGYYQNTAPATFSPSKLSCFCLGNYYDLPHSPDLSLTMSREYDGIKTIQTKGGASLSNAFYTKPPNWGDRGAWELGNDTTSYGDEPIKRLSKSI